MVPQEPLPGTPLFFFSIAELTGGLRLRSIVRVQIALHALCAVLLFAALRRSNPLASLLASLGWAVFLPQFRSTLTPGYDSLTSLVYIATLVALLRYHRSGGLLPLLLAGLFSGAGLWIRSYLFVLPVVCAGILAVFKRTRAAHVCLFLLPVVVMAAGLYAVRRPSTGVSEQLIRGAVWHSFWAGIGQFQNDRGVIAEDSSLQEFAESLAPEEDFRVPNYQYTPAYDDALREAASEYAAEHWPSLLRNSVYRVGWLLFPSFMPSKTLAASTAVRLALVMVGVPVSLAGDRGLRARVPPGPHRRPAPRRRLDQSAAAGPLLLHRQGADLGLLHPARIRGDRARGLRGSPLASVAVHEMSRTTPPGGNLHL